MAMVFVKIVILTIIALSLSVINASQQGKPVLLWHGMGDSCCNERSMVSVAKQIWDQLPDVNVYSVQIGDGSADSDQKASFFGNLNDQVQGLCNVMNGKSSSGVNVINLRTMKSVSQADLDLLKASGVNALGFSQGGQALRAYIERCNQVQVYNLITFGSQHGGQSAMPNCDEIQETLIGEDSNDVVQSSWWCSLARMAIKRGVYLPQVQSRVIQAQYYRDIQQLDSYLWSNIFLPDINNEKAGKNEAYKNNMLKLNKLVLVMFSNDTMAIPKETAWFGQWSDSGKRLVSLRESELYEDDWIGLKQLDESDRLILLTKDGGHMQIGQQWLSEEIIAKYLVDDDSKSVPQHLTMQI
ncbi:hypothetical protein MP228_012506 [Amoeboaphelidium protococcarum]|nr:hypothetical protein MP228_012506 [Amoeboaphelidium protococcarum]